MRIAIIGDIHGNLPAFNAVLEHAAQSGADAIWNVGDCVGFGPFPDQVVRSLRERGAINIAGKYDRKVVRFSKKGAKWRSKMGLDRYLSIQWTHDTLSQVSLEYLSSLPKKMTLRWGEFDFLIIHDPPPSTPDYSVVDIPDEHFVELAEKEQADVIISGGSHMPFCRKIGEIYAVSPGSVGLPRDGIPTASYALLELAPELMKVGQAPELDLKVRHYRVNYHVDDTVQEIRDRELPEAFAQMFIQARDLEVVQENPREWLIPEENSQAWWEFSFFNIPLIKNKNGDEPLQAVIKLAESYTYNIEHVHQTTRLTLRIFDELKPLHRMGSRERFWLQCAALLHDIGKPRANQGHHKTARDMIIETPHLPFDKRERNIIGSIARYHRRAWPKDKHKHFKRLTPIDQRQVTILAAILRVADGLDSPRRSNVEDVRCDYSPHDITIQCTVNQKAHKERQRALKKGKLLEFAFQRKLFIEWQRPR